jgi:hypothetical protein
VLVLVLVRHLVELHGGQVHAESPGEGKGATFTVELPLMSAALEAPAPEPERATAGGLGELPDRPSVDAGDLIEDPAARSGASGCSSSTISATSARSSWSRSRTMGPR